MSCSSGIQNTVNCIPDSVFVNGGGGPTTGAHPSQTCNSHDIIRFSPKKKEHIFEACVPFYERGLSLGEIARQAGFAKSSLRQALVAHGLPLRCFAKNQIAKPDMTQNMHSGRIPYGHCYLEGKLVVEPWEYKIVLQIVKQWKLGKCLTAIAR